jgi:hypothetical protein
MEKHDDGVACFHARWGLLNQVQGFRVSAGLFGNGAPFGQRKGLVDTSPDGRQWLSSIMEERERDAGTV